MVYFSAALVAALLPFVAAAPVSTESKAQVVDVSDKFLVSLKAGADAGAHKAFVTELHKRSLEKRGAKAYSGLRHEYDFGSFKGYSGHFDADTISAIKASPEVDIVEAQQVYHTTAITSQSNVPSYGLAYISVKKPGGSTYYYDTTAGSGSVAYIVDTGVLTTHNTFGGRATWGYNAADGSSNRDGAGHGTHVAGTTAGSQYGVAKSAKIVAVKVLGDNGSGSNADVIEGINWAANDAKSKGVKAAINLSLGGGFSQIVNNAVNNAVGAGVAVAVAAGNDGADAKNYSPASATKVLTVGATTSSNALASYSNYGASVDILAPGTSITSSWNTGNSATNSISGTSMATPHITGLLAYFRTLENLSATAAQSRIVALGTKNVISGVRSGTVNLFAYNNSGR